MQTSAAVQQSPQRGSTFEYGRLLAAVRDGFASVVGTDAPLFTTDAADLFTAYLDALPSDQRQHHNCHACRHFVERFGHLVTIDASGRTTAAMWADAPDFYALAFAAVRRVVARAKVTGVFLSSDAIWGTPVTKEWRHMHVVPPRAMLYRPAPMLNASQAMAAKREDFGTLCRGLAEFSPEHVAQAITIIDAEALRGGEKVAGVAKWIAALHDARKAAKGKTSRENVTWLAVATAPPGFCHIKTTMIGTLLEDLAAGLPLDDVRRKFNEKMGPLAYQRPQAPPTAGNIAQAEKIIAEMGLAPALRRRYARLEDLVTLWTPTPTQEKSASGGVFSHLVPKGEASARVLEVPGGVMTWTKFRDTVLPTAARIECCVPDGRAPFIALVTAADPEAPPLLQWDNPDRRNPVSWYVHAHGSQASQWGLRAASWANVTAFTLLPFMWTSEAPSHHGAGVVAVLDGCREQTQLPGAMLFPQLMRAELHAVRATIEAHSQSSRLDGREEATACGIDMRKGQTWGHAFRVTSRSGSVVIYKLDRWD